MKTKLLATLVMLLAVLGACAGSYADDEHYVIQEASRRGMKLITRQQAIDIAMKRLESGTRDVHIKDIDLDDDFGHSDEFRPVYELECVANGQEYDIVIDAVTSEILKFKLDD